jgi:hypothetical protein
MVALSAPLPPISMCFLPPSPATAKTFYHELFFRILPKFLQVIHPHKKPYETEAWVWCSR